MIRRLPVRTPTLPPATHTNCYVLDGVTVVDPASPFRDEQDRLVADLDGLPLERIVLTHHHLDHVGGASDLARRRSLPIYAHAVTQALCPDIEFAGTLDEGDTLHGWDVLFTPGHAPGHVCFRKQDQLVVGDMVASEGTIVLEPNEGSLRDYLASLERLLDLGEHTVHPAHGEPIRETKFRDYITHRHARTDQIRAALRQVNTPLEIVELVYADTIPRFVYPLAARQVVCHLTWLSEEGEATRDGDHWRAT
ncbi:MAG: MBL fold metallo-hydrolase [Proteobacteria bacterium]|nr:MBL fold metallo-hydrolase [Pseudomonadota bacterium]MCP4918644.1 MBL fold metallo-hydrolase [Pseudomonadota bacterium]